MRFPTVRGWLALLAASLLLGCETTPVGNSAALVDLDKEWVSLYQQRLAGQPVTDQFVQLSSRAEQRGDANQDSDPATAAGFYRIAATTAWTAGPPRNQRLITLRDKGDGVCAKVASDPGQQPRDCAFIRVAPDLATLDQQAAATKSLVSAGATLDGANLVKAKSVADTTSKSIRRVLEGRPPPASQSKSFDDYIARNLNTAFCNLQGLVGLPSTATDEELQPLIASAKAAQDALRSASISTQCSAG
jgi:hypothetical protein